jgi:hypothetical protein
MWLLMILLSTMLLPLIGTKIDSEGRIRSLTGVLTFGACAFSYSLIITAANIHFSLEQSPGFLAGCKTGSTSPFSRPIS